MSATVFACRGKVVRVVGIESFSSGAPIINRQRSRKKLFVEIIRLLLTPPHVVFGWCEEPRLIWGLDDCVVDIGKDLEFAARRCSISTRIFAPAIEIFPDTIYRDSTENLVFARKTRQSQMQPRIVQPNRDVNSHWLAVSVSLLRLLMLFIFNFPRPDARLLCGASNQTVDLAEIDVAFGEVRDTDLAAS